MIEEYKNKHNDAYLQYLVNDLAAMEPSKLQAYLGDIDILSRTIRENKDTAKQVDPN